MRLLLVEDNAAYRAALRVALAQQRDLEVVGEAADGASALTQVHLLRPDVVLIEHALPTGDGIITIQEIRGACPETTVVVLTRCEDAAAALAALTAGAQGLISKSVPVAKLVAP